MSFSAKVKGEICRYTDISKEEALAELSAIMKGSGTIGFSGKGLSFRITTENPASARHIFTILKEHFDIHSKLMVKKSNSLKKNNIYMVLIDEEMGVRDLLQETGIFKEIDGVKWFNDSIGTSPTRTIAGLNSFEEKIVLIAGGYDKHLDYAPIAKPIVKNVSKLILMGATADKIEKAVKDELLKEGKTLPIYRCLNLQEVVNKAKEVAREGEVVLFSPASASFDLFKNFEDRGNKFKEEVYKL